MLLTNNELYNINGGSIILDFIKKLIIYIKFTKVKYFI